MNQRPEDQEFDETMDMAPDTRQSSHPDDLEPTIGNENPSQSVSKQTGDFPDADKTGRYQLKDEIARGGMGVVVLGQDQELGRELAIKVMLPSASGRETARQRFIEEAQIGGQLQHPGIVPVYDLGKLDDQRPFFAMKLVKGQTLSERLRDSDNHQDDLPQFLNVFAQICQTMAYAHDKGVIHRDLKPSNIMVGAFGEVQVMDWGLAKVLEGPDSQSNRPSSSQREASPLTAPENDSITTEGHSHTQYGSVLGTLAYMSPEQAMGAIETLGRPADVFALGSILCQILTGKPPYVTSETNTQTLHQMAVQGNLADCMDRLDQSQQDPELVQLVRDCLNPSPKHRLADAGKVADRITDYLQSVTQKLQTARIDQAASEAREKEAVKTAAAESQRRKLSVIAGGLVAALLAVAGIGTFLVQHNRAQVAQERSNAKLQAMQRDAAARRQIEGDMMLATKLLEKFDEVPPTKTELQSLDLAFDRIDSQVATSNLQIDNTSMKELQESAARLKKDNELLNELLAFRIRNEGQHVRRGGRDYFFSSGQGYVVAPKLRADNGDIEAFEKWGLLQKQTTKQWKQRIGAMPDWARGEAINALHHLATTWTPPNRYEKSIATQWIQPNVKSFKSLRGATLTMLPDNSVLASGENPNCDIYEIVFSVDQPIISSIRIEALTHSSFPNSGPGRGTKGYASITNIELGKATKQSPKTFASIEIKSSDTDYNYFGEPLSPTGWNLTHGSGKSHTGYFHFKQPIHVTSDDLLRLRITGNVKRQWGYQNLGRFRVSFGFMDDSDDLGNRVANVSMELFKSLEFDSWTQRLWKAINERDVAAMLELANDPQIKEQPAVYLARLAGALIQYGDEYETKQLRDNLTWFLCDDKIESQAEFLIDEDGVATSNKDPGHTDTISLQVNRGPAVTAIRLDTLTDASLPRNGPGRGPNTFNCLLRDIGLYHTPSSGSQREHIPFDDAVSNHVLSLLRPISYSFDSAAKTAWSVAHPSNQPMCSAIFTVGQPTDTNRMRNIQIEAGANIDRTNATLAKFRCWWTSDPIPKVTSPKQVAYNVLHSRYLTDPNNSVLLLALSRLSREKDPPDHNSSVSFATAALTLRPKDPVALENYVRSAISLNPASDSPWLQRIRHTAIVSDELEPGSSLLRDLFDAEISKGDWAANEQRNQDCADAYLTALQINPSEFTRYRKLGSVLMSLGDDELALKYLLKATELNPTDEWPHSNIAELMHKNGKTAEAIKHIQISLKKHPNGKLHLDRLQAYQEASKDWSGALNTFTRRFGDPQKYGPHRRLDYAVLLANQENLGELEKQTALTSAKELEMYLQCDLALMWLKLKQRDKALSSIKQALNRKKDAKKTILNRFKALIERPYTTEHDRHIEPYADKYRFTELAEILHEAMPDSKESHRLMVYAYAANRHWKSVIRAIPDISNAVNRSSPDWFTSHLALAGAHDALGNSDLADEVLDDLSRISKQLGQRAPDKLGNRKDNIPLRKPLKIYRERF